MSSLVGRYEAPAFWLTVCLVVGWMILIHLYRERPDRFLALSFPGTLLHEGAHLLVGLAVGARPASVDLWPRRTRSGWTLGSVSFHETGLFGGLPIAAAPVLLLPLGLGLLGLAQVSLEEDLWLVWLLLGYLSATILHASRPSGSDLRAGPAVLLIYVVAACLSLWWMTHP